MSLTLEESRLHKAYVNLENLARHPADLPARHVPARSYRRPGCVAFRAAHGLPYGPADVLACACIMRGQHGEASWLLRFMRAWRYACAVQDAESAVRA